MADTSQRKARITLGSGVTLVEKNKEGATIPQGNEVAQNVYNIIRSESIDFNNTENFNQSESAYFSTANQTYNEAEKLLQALETKKAMLSYTASFNSNEYTLDARAATISELIANGIEQDLQDKAVYLSPVAIENGFTAQFIAPANNTGSATIKIQKYDGTYHTTLTAKKYSGTSLVNLVANDIKQNQLYTIVIISGEAVVFGIHSLQTQQRIIFSYVNGTTVSYTSGGFIFDDFSGSGFVNAGTLNLTGLTANSSWYIFAIANPTTGATQIQHYNTLTPTPPIGFTKKKLLFAFITNASSQLREIIIDADGWVTYVGVGVNEGLNGFTNNGQSIQKPLTIPAGLRCKVKLNAFADEEKAFWIGDGTSSSFNLSSQVGANFGIGVVGIPERYNGWVVACTNTNAEVRISSWNYPGVFVTSNLTLHTQAYKIIF